MKPDRPPAPAPSPSPEPRARAPSPSQARASPGGQLFWSHVMAIFKTGQRFESILKGGTRPRWTCGPFWALFEEGKKERNFNRISSEDRCLGAYGEPKIKLGSAYFVSTASNIFQNALWNQLGDPIHTLGLLQMQPCPQRASPCTLRLRPSAPKLRHCAPTPRPCAARMRSSAERPRRCGPWPCPSAPKP